MPPKVPKWMKRVRSAVDNNDVDTLRTYLDDGVDVEWRNGIHDFTLAMRAAVRGHVLVLQELCNYDADLEATLGRTGKTVLHLVAEQDGDLAYTAGLLVRLGSNKEVQDEKGMTPLMVAASKGHQTVAERLLACGCRVDYMNSNSDSPFHLASRGGHLPVVRLFLRWNVRLDVIHDSGQLADDVAESSGHIAVADAIRMVKSTSFSERLAVAAAAADKADLALSMEDGVDVVVTELEWRQRRALQEGVVV